MTFKEKCLYHQIHPLKLLADVGGGLASLYPLWRHQWPLALAIMILPPTIAALAIMCWVNLEPYRESALGRYVARSMTPTMQALRGLGMAVMALGAWWHSIPLICAGVLPISFAWFHGLILPRRRKE